ncbi:MAG TPA: FG-GAP-like repeat-containing protein [Puia sp.]|nr:FG-GAP-like repeat-containing protein [Puia sp.]
MSAKLYCFLTLAALSATTTFAQPPGSSPRLLAYQYLRQNNIDQAENAFAQAIKADPRDIFNYRDLAILYLTKNNYAKAESTASAGLRLKPDDKYIRSVLAKVYIQKGDRQNATRQLDELIRRDPKNIFAYCALAALGESKERYLLTALKYAPANIVIRFRLADALLDHGKLDSTISFLQDIKRGSPDFPAELKASYNELIQSLRAGNIQQSKTRIQRFGTVLELTGSYISALAPLNGPQLPSGYAEFASSQNIGEDFTTSRGFATNKGFTDATRDIGLSFEGSGAATSPGAATRSVVAVTDYTAAGEMYLYTSSIIGGRQRSRLLISTIGRFQDNPVPGGIDHAAEDNDAAFIDYDNDGYPDLFIATTKGILLYKNKNGKFTSQPRDIGLSIGAGVNKMLFADFDQDGDIDIYVSTNGTSRFFRNNGNGTFTEQANQMGLAIANAGANMDFADYEQDGDLDIIAAGETHGPALLNNNRHSRFKDVAAAAGLRSAKYNGKVVAFGDYNNDGLPDLFIAGANGQVFLLKNVNGDHFVVDLASKTLTASLHDVKIADAVFTDYDNDGHVDLLIAGTTANASEKAVQLFHNNGPKGFSNVSSLLPPTIGQATQIAIADFNADGDDDIFLAGPGGIRLIRNDVGNTNHYMQVQLTGLSYGSSKNNRTGIGAQVELRAGTLYQMKTIKRPITNFGLGSHRNPETARIIWPNGTPQYIVDPTADERIMEEQMLKGSCPFLFAWNGEKYSFLKDMMWRSALGMPLALKDEDTIYAYSGPSKEYLLIPGNALKPRDNVYSIKITEELWEAVYFDKIALTAVDHPDSVDLFADERMAPPPYPGKKVYGVANKFFPVTAVDGNGNDVLKQLKAYDFQYVSNFDLGKYQGVAEDHDLILDLGKEAEATDSLYLFLRGWTFPADASINLAMAQSDAVTQHPPELQVMNPQGLWRTVVTDMGYPMGKDKMVVVNLSGKFLTPTDRRIRIRTNMQVYWDEIFFSKGLSNAPIKMHDLTLTNANLEKRGYSAMYRKGGPFGPHWFDYYAVSHGEKWRDLTGYYTRYGDVLPLLLKGDDEYIIAGGGDEISMAFDAARLPPLPRGWRRDFLIYSEGWVKDGDLNTAYGQTVAPLPFHAMPGYPYKSGIAYPSDPAHRQYLQNYNTRLITTDNFKMAIK